MATPVRRGPPSRSSRSLSDHAKVHLGAPSELGVKPIVRDKSNARLLQTALEARCAKPPAPPIWSRRRTLAFVVLASSILWAIIIGAVAGGMLLIAG